LFNAKGEEIMKKTKSPEDKPKCGLCGKIKNLTKTECCGRWICDDEHEYVPFSYATNSCSRNHRRYTLCGFHFAEEHKGSWQDCPECRKAFETEMYVYYGTNEFNFQKLQNPPAFDPTLCSKCGTLIRLGNDESTISGKEYWCEKCSRKEMQKKMP
jgi:hypothetical protein